MCAELRHLRKLRLAEPSPRDGGEGSRFCSFCYVEAWDPMVPVLAGLTELSLMIALDVQMVRGIPMGCMATHLAVLNVCSCTFTDGGLLVLAKEVAALTALRVLDASYAGVSDEIAAELACSLHQMKNVEHVKLGGNPISNRLLRLTLRPSIRLSVHLY